MMPTEHAEQVAVFRWAAVMKLKYPELHLLYAIPNGGDRHALVAKKLKAEGVKPGVPDMFLPVARGGFYGLYVEMKRQKGSSVTQAQREFLSAVEDQGYLARVCKGSHEAINVIEEYLHLKVPRGLYEGA